MQVYDLSVVLRSGMPVWPGDPDFSLQPRLSTASGDRCNVSLMSCSSHTGTHVDAPFHFIPDGKTLDQVSLDRLVGPVVVVEIAGAEDIGPEQLDRAVRTGDLPPDTMRVIFKTLNTCRRLMQDDHFHRDFVAITPAGAKWLVAHGIKTVGIDYLSVEAFDVHEPLTHWTLLGAEIFVMEGLDLREVPPGYYTLSCGALKLQSGDGTPARIFLLPPYSGLNG